MKKSDVISMEEIQKAGRMVDLPTFEGTELREFGHLPEHGVLHLLRCCFVLELDD